MFGSSHYIQILFISKIEYYCQPRDANDPKHSPNGGNRALFVGSDVYREAAFGKHHPLSIIRVAGVVDICEILGWLDQDQFRESPRAGIDELQKFHHADYVEAFIAADSRGSVDRETRERYRIGTMENPLFPGLFKRASTAVGGSILAAKLAMDRRVVFHPSGGTHHGRAERASGFCYFNDPVFAILTFLEQGIDRVLYVDLDAHHGDGVQDAFADEPRVLTISIHEEKRWPYSGLVEDRAGGSARNLPVPRGFNDSELDFLIEKAVRPLAREFNPGALVITCGADGLSGDPLSHLALSNVGLWQAVEKLLETCTRSVVLGGGGYNPWTVVRCWGGLWGRLSGREIPLSLPQAARVLLQNFECDLIDEEEIPGNWISKLADQANFGPVSEQVARLPGLVLN